MISCLHFSMKVTMTMPLEMIPGCTRELLLLVLLFSHVQTEAFSLSDICEYVFFRECASTCCRVQLHAGKGHVWVLLIVQQACGWQGRQIVEGFYASADYQDMQNLHGGTGSKTEKHPRFRWEPQMWGSEARLGHAPGKSGSRAPSFLSCLHDVALRFMCCLCFV